MMRVVAMRLLALAALLCLAFGTAQAGGNRVSGPNFDGVVLDLPSTQKGVDVWVPGYDAINEMERAFPAYVKKYIKIHKVTLTKPISKYKRQYVGIVDGGKKLIGVSYFYEKTDFVTSKRWLQQVGSTAGGGDDYMGAVYDAGARKFVTFEICPPAPKGK
jgi:hypothetical protein